MPFDEDAQRHGESGPSAGFTSDGDRSKNRFERLQDAMVTRRIDTNDLVSEAFEDDIDHAIFDFERLPASLEGPTSETTRSLFPQPVIDEDVVPALDERHWLDGHLDHAEDKVIVEPEGVVGAATLLGVSAADSPAPATKPPSAGAARPARPPLVSRLRNTEPADVVGSHTLPAATEAGWPGAASGRASSALLELELEVGDLASDELEVSDPQLAPARSEPYLDVEIDLVETERTAARDAAQSTSDEPPVLPPQPEARFSDPRSEAPRAPSFSAARAARQLSPPAPPSHYGTARRVEGPPVRHAARRSSRLLALEVLGYVILAAAAGAGLGYLASM